MRVFYADVDVNNDAAKRKRLLAYGELVRKNKKAKKEKKEEENDAKV